MEGAHYTPTIRGCGVVVVGVRVSGRENNAAGGVLPGLWDNMAKPKQKYRVAGRRRQVRKRLCLHTTVEIKLRLIKRSDDTIINSL